MVNLRDYESGNFGIQAPPGSLPSSSSSLSSAGSDPGVAVEPVAAICAGCTHGMGVQVGARGGLRWYCILAHVEMRHLVADCTRFEKKLS